MFLFKKACLDQAAKPGPNFPRYKTSLVKESFLSYRWLCIKKLKDFDIELQNAITRARLRTWAHLGVAICCFLTGTLLTVVAVEDSTLLPS